MTNECLKNQINLLILHINNDNITDDGISHLINLQELYCFANELTQLPEEIKYLINLKYLYCSYNNLTQLPKEIKYLE